jgi:uncharacterized linocin/CFP29 family protein
MSNVPPEQIDWSQDPFKSVNVSVDAEAKRTAVGAKFLPPYGPVSSSAPVQADIITIDNTNKTLSINQAVTTPIVDIRAQFTLTQMQYDEDKLTAALTLATRAANLLAQAQDLVFFLGGDAQKADFFKNNPVFLGKVGNVFPNNLIGLLIPDPPNKITVSPKETIGSDGVKYGEHTSSAVGQAYSLLQSKGHNGPYVLVLHSDMYADTIEPLEDTLIMPADRIKFFVTETDASGKDIVRFYGSGALSPLTGLFMSLGGDSMDLVVANSPSTRFSQRTSGSDGGLLFEVYESFTLRLKDPTAVVLLKFLPKSTKK